MKRILCIGDSNTWGYDPRSYFGSQYPSDVRWTGLLQKAGLQVINCGMNGMCVPGKYAFPVIKDLIQRKLPVDIAAVMLGSNDLLNGETVEDTSSKMEAFLRMLAETVEDARIILIAPPVMQRGEWVQDEQLIRESEKLAEAYRELADRLGMEYADAAAWNTALSYDGVHFSPEGHAAFARGLLELISGDPRSLTSPFSVSANTLNTMDQSVENIKMGKVSPPLDLSEFEV